MIYLFRNSLELFSLEFQHLALTLHSIKLDIMTRMLDTVEAKL